MSSIPTSEAGSAEEAHPKKPITIYVNTRPKEETERELTFDEVVALAQPLQSGPNIEITVAYRKAAGTKHKGDLTEGETVKIKNGTIFDVTATDKS